MHVQAAHRLRHRLSCTLRNHPYLRACECVLFDDVRGDDYASPAIHCQKQH